MFSNVSQEKKVQQIIKRLQNYIQMLTYHQATDFSKSGPKTVKLNFMPTFERDTKFVELSSLSSSNLSERSLIVLNKSYTDE